MSNSNLLSIKPIIYYPRVAQVGKTYLMTIDLEVEEGFEWQYDDEEYPIYCEVDSELFSIKSVDESIIVLHRFGGSYGASKFLLTALSESELGSIKVCLINTWGIPIQILNLNQIQLFNKTINSPISNIELERKIEEFVEIKEELPIPDIELEAEITLIDSIKIERDELSEFEEEKQEPVSIAYALILTSVAVEYLAVRAHLSDLREEVHEQGTIYERGQFGAERQVWDCGIVEIGAGNSGAALEAEQAIAHFKPDVILCVGIAAGIKDVALGDVVASTKVYGYESGNAEWSFMPRSKIGLSAHSLEQQARSEARKGDWLKRLSSVREPIPRVFVGAIGAGEKIISSTQSELVQFLREHYDDAIAVEMEGLGFLGANRQVEAIVIRGIADLIDSKERSDQIGFQKIACDHASSFAFQLLAKLSYTIPANVPRSGVMSFTGRQEMLMNLHEYLHSGNNDFINLIAVEGMGGSGKTELVIQYIKKHKHLWRGGICWLCAREFNIGTQIVGFALSQLNLQIPEGLNLTDQVAFCWRNWRAGDVLLVLDDVVNYGGDVEPYLPSAILTRFKVVMTTRKKFDSPIQSLSLDVLSPEQSLALMTVLIGAERVHQEAEIAKALCNWLEHLPLGIELVGRYLQRRTELSLSILLFRLREKAQQRQAIRHAALKPDEEINISTDIHGAEAAFELSWAELDSNSQHLAKLLSLFAPAPIPWYLAEAVERKYCEDSDSGKAFDVEELKEAKAKLISLHLLQVSQQQAQIYRLHSLIREFFRSKLEGEADSEMRSITNSILPKDINTQNILNILSHSISLIQESLQSELENVLPGRDIESVEIPDDNNEGKIQAIDNIESLDIHSNPIQLVNDNQLLISFKTDVECLISYFIFKADYYALDEDRDISVDENNDHTLSAEEYYLLSVEGLAIIELNMDGFENILLLEDEISDFLSSTEILVKEISRIEVLPRQAKKSSSNS